MNPSSPPTVLWPLVVFTLAALGVVGGMIGLSALLGERHRARSRNEPYESGVPPTGATGGRLSIRFYLVAVFFVIFDLEAVFLLAWAIAVEDAGWTGFVEIVVFVAILLVALLYLWRQGALDWGTRPGLRKEAAP